MSETRKPAVFAATIFAAGLQVLAAPQLATAAEYKVLYSFCAQLYCTDGKIPYAPLNTDGAGNLFGTTYRGGDNGRGTLFQLAQNAAHTKWTYRRLHSFCSTANCADGDSPLQGVVLDAAGNLYGTALIGGVNTHGIVFEYARDGTSPKFRVLYDFCALAACADGGAPQHSQLTYQGQSSGAAYDGHSPLYGVAAGGGANTHGIIYRLTPPADGGTWRQEVLYSFCTQPNCTDATASNGILLDDTGKLFGAASLGGVNNLGVLLRFAEKKKGWSAVTLHDFCTSDCADGGEPTSPLLQDNSGRMFGTTRYGGVHNGGTLYGFKPGSAASYKVVFDFCAATYCADGNNPAGQLAQDGDGNFYGATLLGGNPQNPGGVVYALRNGVFELLHTFCSEARCADGRAPIGGVVRSADGVLHGTTQLGGLYGGGTVFEVVP
jgi:uncharacterized repeat protein (TIGR03803 family)